MLNERSYQRHISYHLFEISEYAKYFIREMLLENGKMGVRSEERAERTNKRQEETFGVMHSSLSRLW